MTRTNLYPALTATLLVLSMALVGVFAAPAAVGSADARSAATPHEPTANYTYSPDSHAPGAQDIGAEHYAVGLEKDLTALHTVVVESEAFDFSDCSSTNTEAFGIDRGNDDPNTQTDEGLVTKYKSIDFRANKIVVEFYKEGGIGQSTVALNTDDQIVARGGGCYDNPDEKGWYQISGRLNGSTNDQTSTDYDITVQTHYIYVCDCDSRQEAVDKLGPPPSQQSDDGGDSSTPTPTAEPTESTGGGDDGSGGDATATPTTATPTESSGGGDDGTATATPGDTGGDQSTATPTGDDTATPTNDTTNTSDDGTAAPNGSDTGTNTTATTAPDSNPTNSTTTSTNGSSNVSDDSDVGGTTPSSSGDGPGFGFLAAVGALAAGALLVRRRDD